MRLRDLDPTFIRYLGAKTFREIHFLANAHGVMFLCPKCFAENGGARGTHSVICWSRSRGTPDDMEPLPGRWALNGSSLDDLTLNADPPSGARSVQLDGGCNWHGFITNGEVTTA